MLTKYTLGEMKEIWKRQLGLLTDDCGCVVTRHDGIALDSLIADHIRIWYTRLLLTEPVALLPIREMAPDVDTARRYGSNCIEIELPEKGVRLVSVQLTDWKEPVSVFYGAESAEAVRQRSERLGATQRHPVAVLQGRVLRLYGLESRTGFSSYAPEMLLLRIRSLMMVSVPEETDTFILHQSLLSTIPTTI